ncbi:hypothetical protein RB195_009622 [Necator americanus]|uniref:Ankyrin repeat protein n=1 Tax=Necator americanus TaxID=51031 RepID=A0ABR1CU48_NECAM
MRQLRLSESRNRHEWMNNDLTRELGRRKRAVLGARESIEDVVKKTRNTGLRAHFFNTTILPALTYASETWALSKHEENERIIGPESAHPHFNSLAKSPTCKNILITGVAVADRRLLLDSTLPSPDHDLPFPFSVVQESPLGAARNEGPKDEHSANSNSSRRVAFGGLADSSLVLWRLPGRFGWGDRMKDEEKDLFAAIEAGDTEKVLELLKSGIDINCHDATGMSPLATAAYRGNFEIAKLCIEKGGDVNDKQHTQSYTPLMFAALAG